MTRILSNSGVPYNTIRANLVRLGATQVFLESILPAVWFAARLYNVNSVGAVAQAAKETGYGKFEGVITAEWKNTCGLKVPSPSKFGFPGETDYEPFAHQIQASWHIGAKAQVQHLVAYTGGHIDNPLDLVDGRYSLIVDRFRCETFDDLSGKWAGAADYGQQIELVITELSKPVDQGQ